MKIVIEANSTNKVDLQVLLQYVTQWCDNNLEDLDGQIVNTSFGDITFTLKDNEES